MSFSTENIIQKQVIDIVVNAPVDGFEFQNAVESLCRNELKKRLENLLEKYNFLEEVVHIDLLFAEVEYSRLIDFETSFTEKIVQEVEKVLLQRVSNLQDAKTGSIESISKRWLQLLVFYLQNGYLPWWSSVKTTQQWHEKLNELLFGDVKNTDWVQFYPVLSEPNVRKRISEIFTKNQFWKLIDNISLVNLNSVKVDYEIIVAIFTGSRQQPFEAGFKDLLLSSIADAPNKNFLVEYFSDRLVSYIKSEYPKLYSGINPERIVTTALKTFLIAEKTQVNTFISDKINESKMVEKDLIRNNSKKQFDEEIYIDNSGLVIAAAYLHMFFKDLGFIANDNSLNTNRAIAVLQYLVKGTDDYEEFECVLPKILCGLELNEPIAIKRLTKKEKQKVNNLLKSILEHWAVLKSTSADGLRVSFLQREGRLIFRNNEWHLKVQQDAYDMLLAHLPWNINMIKLPWMNCLLHVEWT